MFKAVGFVINEHANNISRILKLSFAHMKKQTIKTSLGLGWVYIHDIIFITIYVMFRTFMSGDAKIEGMHRVVYLITGLIPWFFMSEVLGTGSNAIKMNKAIVSSIKFPITIIPTMEVMAILFKRIFTFVLLFIGVAYFGYIANFNILLFFYYLLSMVILMLTLNLIFSAFNVVSGDFEQLYRTIIRVLMFSLPILWSFEMADNYEVIAFILRLNPMVYLILGFRDAFVHNMMPDLTYTLYFWTVVILAFLTGCFVQFKLRKYYSDFM